MSKCDLTIVLDKEQDRFQPGDTVTGQLEVRANTDVKVTALTVGAQWTAHGRGNRVSDELETNTLFTGEWRNGEIESYPFTITIPNGPLTYHGDYLNVSWCFKARADIPWAFDCYDEKEFLLELPDEERRSGRALNQITEPIHAVEHTTGAIFCLGIFFLPFIGMGAFLTIMGIATLLGATNEAKFAGLFMIPFGLVFGGLPAAIFLWMLRSAFAQMRLGPVDIDLSPNALQPGDRFKCTVSFTPKGDAELNGINLTFSGAEVVVSGSGTDKTTHTNELYKEEVSLPEAQGIRAHRLEMQSFRHEFTVPQDAAYSFSARDNRLVWSVKVHIDIAKWPDYEKDVTLLVEPY